MQLKRHQWVGLLAGLLLFSGSWLVAYTDNTFWALLTVIMVGGVLWSAVRLEGRSTVKQHFIHGVTAGLLSVLVARVLGLVATGWAFGKWGGVKPIAAYADVSDTFRGILNGGVWSTITVLVFGAAFGGLVALLEPEQTTTTRVADKKPTTAKKTATSKKKARK